MRHSHQLLAVSGLVNQGIPFASNSNRSWGDASGADRANAGLQFTASLTGNIENATIGFNSAVASSNIQLELYTESSGSPGVPVGTASETINISAAGDYNFNFPTPVPIVNATTYWMIVKDVGTTFSGGLNSYTPRLAQFGSGNHDTITLITDTGANGQNDEWWIQIWARKT